MKRFLAVAFLLVLAGCASRGGGSMTSSGMSMSTNAMAGTSRTVVAPGNYNTNGSWSPGSELPDVRF